MLESRFLSFFIQNFSAVNLSICFEKAALDTGHGLG
jgi:hypothetical protein